MTRAAALATGLELRDLGFTWVFAPVADVTIGAADPTIGARSPSQDPRLAAKAVAAAIKGYDDAGVVSTVKHFPGHGGATSDSHDTLPVLDSTLAELESHDLPPFESAFRQHAPAVMMSHLDLTAIAPGVPAIHGARGLRPAARRPRLRGRHHHRLARHGRGRRPAGRRHCRRSGRGRPAPDAGRHRRHAPDRHPRDRLDGDVSRERAEEAAARVVALQMWQARMAAAARPRRRGQRHVAASADLESAASEDDRVAV